MMEIIQKMLVMLCRRVNLTASKQKTNVIRNQQMSTIVTSIRISTDLRAAIKKAAHRNEQTQKDFIAAALEMAVLKSLYKSWQASPRRDEPKWISVEDRLPEAGVKVLAVFINSHGSPRRICARYVRRWTEEVSGDCEENYCEYSDEHDEYYTCEGWYEAIENWGDFSSVHVCEGDVTHWMPLPATPNGGNEE